MVNQINNLRTINGRYELVRLLGEGSLGQVYHARDLSEDGREMALKLLPGERQTVRPTRVGIPPAIDGRLDDSAWADAAHITDFVQLQPLDNLANQFVVVQFKDQQRTQIVLVLVHLLRVPAECTGEDLVTCDLAGPLIAKRCSQITRQDFSK